MGLLVDGVWRDDSYGTARTRAAASTAPTRYSATGSRPTAAPARPAKVAFRPSPGAIISMSRSPVRGRIAPSSSAS